MYVCMYVFMYLCINICMYVCMYVHVCMYICMLYVCVYVCTYLLCNYIHERCNFTLAYDRNVNLWTSNDYQYHSTTNKYVLT